MPKKQKIAEFRKGDITIKIYDKTVLTELLEKFVKNEKTQKETNMPKHLQDYCRKLYNRFLNEGDIERAEIVKNALAVLGVNVEA